MQISFPVFPPLPPVPDSPPERTHPVHPATAARIDAAASSGNETTAERIQRAEQQFIRRPAGNDVSWAEDQMTRRALMTYDSIQRQEEDEHLHRTMGVDEYV